MKKKIKILVGVIIFAALIFSLQQGVKYFLQGPARLFNSVVISGSVQNVKAAKKALMESSQESKDYFYKTVYYKTEALDENEQPLKDPDTGEQLYTEYSFIVLSKSTAHQMLDAQMFRVKEEEIPDGSIATIPMTEIRGLDSQENLYFGAPELYIEMETDGISIPLAYANYAWIGYTPEPATVAILNDATYDSIPGEQMQISMIRLKGGKKDLRDNSSKNAVISMLTAIPDIDIDYAYAK